MNTSRSESSEQVKQENALRRLEKLAAVGQEASTIAHEINNPLESLTNLLYLIKLSDSMDEVKEYVSIAQQELARITEITVQTLRFHRQASRPVNMDCAELAQNVMALYSGRMLLRKVDMEWRLRDAPRITCLEGEIRQVLNNLVRNALDAMSGRGRLMIRVNPSCELLGHRSGVRITVADTGEGISPEMTGRLFALFQTTKEQTGTGLGLWVSRGIVEKHGGTIRVRSRRAKEAGGASGTVFAVWLPVECAPGLEC
ncbi:MAG: sensor signal transduction histidine kinase [Acidobacteriaceae bacterium]|nr:sensor signal transduction histidine kinase [Acidobacteriaceae bacterium]